MDGGRTKEIPHRSALWTIPLAAAASWSNRAICSVLEQPRLRAAAEVAGKPYAVFEPCAFEQGLMDCRFGRG